MRCLPRVSCANCTLGRPCIFADAVSIPIDAWRAEGDDPIYATTGRDSVYERGSAEPAFIPSDEPEDA